MRCQLMIKKQFKTILMLILITCSLCACNKNVSYSSSNDGTEELATCDLFLEEYGEEDFIQWEDNSLDTYSITVNIPIKATESEDCFLGGASILIGEDRAALFQKHLAVNGEKEHYWDELIIAEDSGETYHHRLAFPYTPENLNQVWTMGEVQGTNHYICMNLESGAERQLLYHFFETDEQLHVLDDFYVDCFDPYSTETPDSMIMDNNGNIHLIVSDNEGIGWTYYVIKNDGKLIAKERRESEGDYGYINFSLRSLYNGDIVVHATRITDKALVLGTDLFSLNIDTGELHIIVEQKEDFNEIYDYTLLDDRTIIYVSRIGVFTCDLEWENTETLYRWQNHGMTVNGAKIKTQHNGKIGIYYVASDSDYYAVLRPTLEETEIKQITFVVSEQQKEKLWNVVTSFNRKYPTCNIQMETDYEYSRLMTELISGNGPVLIDTTITGFANQTKYWEPLDYMLETIELREKLNEKALELGKIEGKTYGIVSDFYLDTLIVPADMPVDNWTYEDFAQAILGNKSISNVFPPVPLNDSAITLVLFYFSHGIDDTYFIDLSKSKSINTLRFAKIIDIAENYCCDDNNLDLDMAFDEELILCDERRIHGLSSITYDSSHYEHKTKYIGFPTKTGGTTYMVAGSQPITVSKSATAEEKKIAFSFLREYLSYESQMNAVTKQINQSMSIRKDVLEKQILMEYQSILTEEELTDSQRESLSGRLDEDLELLRDLLEQSQIEQRLPYQIEEIILEEISSWRNGGITKELMLDHVQNRVQNYLDEE